VLQSKASHIGGISWSAIGFTYFTGSLLFQLFAGMINPVALSLLAWINLAALPYVLFSVFYQWRVARQWCVLCLSVQVLLVLQFVTALADGRFDPAAFSRSLDGNTIFLLASAYLIP